VSPGAPIVRVSAFARWTDQIPVAIYAVRDSPRRFADGGRAVFTRMTVITKCVARTTTVLVVVVVAVFCVGQERSVASVGGVRKLVDRPGALWSPNDYGEFGVNGTRLRWTDIERPPFTLDLATSSNSVTSHWPAGLAFSAGRTAARQEGGGNTRYNTLGVGSSHGRAELENFQTPDEGPGGYISAPHALGPYIAYGWYETGKAVTGSCDSAGFACAYTVVRGGLRLINGIRRGRLVTDAPVAAFGLSNTGTVAYVRASTRWHNWARYGDHDVSTVDVISLWSPRVLQRIRVPGKVVNLAVTDRVLAVRTQTRTRWAVVLFDLWSGKKLRMIRLKQEWCSWLALRGSTAVMFMARNLVGLATYSGAKRVLRRIRGETFGGLAFAGDTLVWYEQYRSDPKPRYRVMAATV
jgi:hypothetical protein